MSQLLSYFPLKDFWGHVVGCAYLCGHVYFLIEALREAEVYDLDIPAPDLGFEHDVLWLQVPVADATLMQVPDGRQDLEGDNSRFRL